jgi:glycosyltransferase involved in cell wall biosynthesis
VTPTIVHVASAREWRGGQRQVWLLAQALGRLGVKQVVVTGIGTELARRLHSSSVAVRAVTWKAGIDPRVIPAILGELRQQNVILHAHDAHALILSGVCASLTRTPLVVTRRVDFPLRRPGFWTRADRVIAISHAVAAVLAQSGLDSNRVSVVYSGISLESTRAATPLGVRGLLGLSPTARVAVNVAALVPHKDHATLVATAKHLQGRYPELHWVIAGEGELRGRLDAEIEKLGLGDRVHLMGQISSPERLIADADVFVMSSQEEGLGTSVLEALALGIPVASTTAGGLPEMLSEGAGMLAPAHNPAALGEAVSQILDDPDLRARLVAQGRAAALRFSDTRMADEMRSVYRSLAHSLEGS